MKFDEMNHFSHPQHNLQFHYTEHPFRCDGCKEVGIGSHYKCCRNDDNTTTICDYDLHLHCAIPSPSISHPFYTKCHFEFMSHPPGNIQRYCNACEKDVTGFVYHCQSCGFDLHPCCAKLPMVLHDGDLKLHLYRKVRTPCHRCGRKGRSWTYRSKCKKYNLHVGCVKEMLVDNWQELYHGMKGLDGVMMMRIPSLKGSLETHLHHRKSRKGKAQKCCEIAGLALQFIISAILGDPTTLIVGVIASLMSKYELKSMVSM